MKGIQSRGVGKRIMKRGKFIFDGHVSCFDALTQFFHRYLPSSEASNILSSSSSFTSLLSFYLNCKSVSFKHWQMFMCQNTNYGRQDLFFFIRRANKRGHGRFGVEEWYVVTTRDTNGFRLHMSSMATDTTAMTCYHSECQSHDSVNTLCKERCPSVFFFLIFNLENAK